MRDTFRRAAGGIAGLLVLAGGVGCTEQETGLYIQGNVARVAPACTARADGNAAVHGTGTLDVALKLDYEASLLVGSQLTPRGDKANLRTETMITTITGAEVQLLTDTGELETEFTVPASGVISPDASGDPGFGIIQATLVPASTGVELAASITSRGEIRTRVAQVKVFGETIGGLDVESADLVYVIRICKGCLVDFPPAVVSETGVCEMGTDQNPDVPCALGQDDLVDCRLCRAYNAYCASTDEP
jgi:hypothetical protein